MSRTPQRSVFAALELSQDEKIKNKRERVPKKRCTLLRSLAQMDRGEYGKGWEDREEKQKRNM